MGYLDVPKIGQQDSSLVLSVINQKGGVGKSTTVVNLSASLGQLGYKVLVIDLDPQANSTSGYGIRRDDERTTIYDVLVGDANVEDAILETCIPTVFLVPSSIDLAGAEIELVSQMAREQIMKDGIAGVRNEFDYVLIDCPPSLGLLTLNALVACDQLLIPIQCEYYALEGVSKLIETMDMVKHRINAELKIFGILMTMDDRRTILSHQVIKEVRSHFGSLVFKTVIPRAVKLSEAPSHGVPINLYAPSNKGARAYAALAKEVIERG